MHYNQPDHSPPVSHHEENRAITPIQEAIAQERFQALLDGPGLEPRYHHGDTVTVDTRATAAPGDGVFCRLETGEYAFLLLDRHGHSYNLSQNLFFLRGTFAIIGAIVEVFPV